MKIYVVLFVITLVSSMVFGVPVEQENKNLSSPRNDKPFFGQPFDEIVVESTLNVKRKTDIRQAKNQEAEAKIRTKRQHHHPPPNNRNFPINNIPNFKSSVASAQAQSHDAKSPFGNFGASASGSQSQSLTFGPNGPIGTASFAGTQQYRLPNGQTLDISFGNALGNSGSNNAGGASVSIKNS